MAELKEMGLSWGEAQAQQKTEPCGEALLWPYVPLGTKRISEEHTDCLQEDVRLVKFIEIMESAYT